MALQKPILSSFFVKILAEYGEIKEADVVQLPLARWASAIIVLGVKLEWVVEAPDLRGGPLMRLNEQIKDALDPISPGKHGIWPKHFQSKGKSQL